MMYNSNMSITIPTISASGSTPRPGWRDDIQTIFHDQQDTSQRQVVLGMLEDKQLIFH